MMIVEAAVHAKVGPLHRKEPVGIVAESTLAQAQFTGSVVAPYQSQVLTNCELLVD